MKMKRAQLEDMTLAQLEQEARKFQLQVSNNKNEIIDAIMSYLEQNSLPILDSESGEQADIEQSVEQENTPKATSVDSNNDSNNSLTAFLATLTSQMQNHNQQILELFRQIHQQMMQHEQSVVQQVFTFCNTRGTQVPVKSVECDTVSASSKDLLLASLGFATTSQTIVESSPSANQVSLLAQHIPEFGGGEEENVVVWIQRVNEVAQFHRMTDDITLLAACSKLVKAAENWYKTQSGSMLKSWVELQAVLQRNFGQKVSFGIQMQKVKARQWIHFKESFQQYATEKLALMHSLNLSLQDSIDLLTDGITKASFKATASMMTDISIEQFVEKMQRFTEASNEIKRSVNDFKIKSKNLPCTNCGKTGHFEKTCWVPKVTCFFCKAKGHRKQDCPKLKKHKPVVMMQPTATNYNFVTRGLEISSVMENRSITIRCNHMESEIAESNKNGRSKWYTLINKKKYRI
ncbi:PREDICTED: uncharacterized protein LOC108760149 [Trachymyrmex cornetzi]|uniref:uncharacterized protein LOC108760149 n=1 Tax=Trachymyrmex cornetzi TaxID=471704 RepID=UPI00084EFC84|nr:PREDICTED: uncharacterized protein LOC108760149 [Trachymyrmex cornetzi]